MMKRMRAGTLINALAIPILVGMISAFLSSQGYEGIEMCYKGEGL